MADPILHDVEADAPQEAMEDNQLRAGFVSDIVDALDRKDSDAVLTLTGALHPADIADLLEIVPASYRHRLADALGDRLDGEVLAELNDWVRDDLLEDYDAGEVAEAVTELDTDDAVAIIEDMDADDRREVLDALAPDDRAAIEAALAFDEESAGRLMQRDLVAVPEHFSIADTIAFIKARPDQTTDFWEIFVVDEGHKPVGTMRLSWVLTSPPEMPVTDVMQREQTLIPVDMDQEEVGLQFQKYALISAAVTDGEGRLVGVITVDDIVHIIQQEASEDILKLSGAGDGDLNEPILDTFRVRVVWLIVNLGTAMLASMVIAGFEDTIARLVVLAALMPIVASMGGNAGTQTLAVAVRALATNALSPSNSRRAVWREVRIALLNGATLAGLIGLGVWAIFGNPLLGAVMGSALIINLLVAGLAGMLIPLTLEHFEVDPAVSSAVFVTMCTDITGFFAFLGLAALVGPAALR